MFRSGFWSSRITRLFLPLFQATPIGLAIPPSVVPALAYSTSSTFADLNAFAYQAIRLQHLTESTGFYGLSTALSAIGEVLHNLIELAQAAAAGSGTPSAVPAC
jgi:hypothetical protein